jgi:hypothetical protein
MNNSGMLDATESFRRNNTCNINARGYHRNTHLGSRSRDEDSLLTEPIVTM